MENLSVEQTIAILNNPMEYLSEKKTRIVGMGPDIKAMRYTINAGIMNGKPYFEIMDEKRIICGCAFEEDCDTTFTNTFLRVVDKLNKLP